MSVATSVSCGVVAAALAVLLGSCAHRAPVRPAPTPLPVPAPQVAPARGTVGLEFVADPNAPKPKLGEHQEYAPPQVRWAPLPPYPPEALAAGAPPVTVAVRVTIDERGDVAAITDSPLAASTTGPFAATFRATVERTVRAWSFIPARVDDVKDGRDLDGDGKADYTLLVSAHRIRVFVDVRFEFAIVNGVGSVRMGSPRGE